LEALKAKLKAASDFDEHTAKFHKIIAKPNLAGAPVGPFAACRTFVETLSGFPAFRLPRLRKACRQLRCCCPGSEHPDRHQPGDFSPRSPRDHRIQVQGQSFHWCHGPRSPPC
jgi:hypothetical protein